MNIWLDLQLYISEFNERQGQSFVQIISHNSEILTLG